MQEFHMDFCYEAAYVRGFLLDAMYACIGMDSVAVFVQPWEVDSEEHQCPEAY